MRHKNVLVFLALLSLTIVALISVGCSGSNGKVADGASSVPVGRAVLTVHWPERSRLIPFASESINVRIFRGTQLYEEKLLTRPDNGGNASVTFNQIPTGNATVSAVALPNADGSGVAQAQGQVGVTVVANQTANVHLTLGSTIAKLVVAPNVASLNVGDSSTPIATAYNANNEVVLTQLATLAWTSDHPAIVSVEAGGKIKALTVGTATVTVMETESGKKATVAVTVAAINSGPPADAVYNPANGHYYKVIAAPNGIGWAEAKAAAEAMGGYLATITSSSENDFVFALVDKPEYWLLQGDAYSQGPWLGGHQTPGSTEPGGGWQWVTGEPWNYTNWNANSPNDQGNLEDSLDYNTSGSGIRGKTWDDIWGSKDNSFLPIAYVVEWGTVSAGSDLIAYEGFDYPANAGLVGQTGGVGFTSDGWLEDTSQGSTHSKITATGLSFKNLKTSGKAAQSTSLSPIWHGRPLLHPEGLNATGQVIYASILIRPLDTLAASSPNTFFGFGWDHLFCGGKENGWVAETRGGFGVVNTGILPVQNETAFLVFRITSLDGPDKVELWVNPTPGQPLPAPNATKTDVDIGDPNETIGGSIRFIFDEYRIGRTWASVSPTQ